MKALLVVSDTPTQKQLEDFFSSRQHEVQVCTDHDAALERVQEETVHFVLVQLGSEDRQALELCRRIRLLPQAERIFILVLPESDSTERMRSALEAGADDYLSIPFTRATLQLRLAIGQRFVATRCQNRKIQDQLEHREQRHKLVTEIVHEGLMVVDAEGVIEYVNSGACHMTGLTADDLQGERIDDVLVSDELRERLPGGRLLGNSSGTEEHALPIETKSGKPLWVNLLTAPLPELNGAAQATGQSNTLVVLQDVTAQREAESALLHREEYFRVLWENTTDLITILDSDGRVLYQSASSLPILGWRSVDLVGRELADFLHEDDRAEFLVRFKECLGSDTATRLQFRFRHRKNDWRHLEAICNNLIANPVVGGVIVTSRDVTERRRVDAALKRERAFFQQLFRNSPVGIVILDSVDRVVDCNYSFIDLFQFTLEELQGRPLNEFIVPPHLRQEAAELSRQVIEKKTVEQETSRRRRDGSVVEVSIVGYPIELADHRSGTFGLYTDISERKQAERKLFHDAFHDPLTSLPNRTLLTERIKRSLHRAERNKRYQFALLFIDLDRFKEINDTLGHAAGDAFLIETSRRLESCLRPGDTTARLGGDEFTIVLDDLQQPSDATPIAERILEILSQPFMISGQEVRSSGSIGIAFSTTGYENADDMLRDADAAMYRAKKRGKDCYEIFDPKLHQSALERSQLENYFRQAIQDSDLSVGYLPVLSLKTGQTVGFEAYLYWRGQDGTKLGPDEVIPLAEQTGQVLPLARWLFNRICRSVASWQGRYSHCNNVLADVKFSSREIFQDNFLKELARLTAESGVKASAIGLQIHERLLFENVESLEEILWSLRQIGFRLFIDEFGSGQASFADLQRLPIDGFRIAGSLIQDLKAGSAEAEVVRSIVAVGHSLNLTVIAPEVDHQLQADLLGRLNVPYVQGALYAVPVGEASIGEWIENERTWA